MVKKKIEVYDVTRIIEGLMDSDKINVFCRKVGF